MYEMAYSCFIKGKDVDCVPIDPEENADYERGGEVEVTSEGLLSESWVISIESQPDSPMPAT